MERGRRGQVQRRDALVRLVLPVFVYADRLFVGRKFMHRGALVRRVYSDNLPKHDRLQLEQQQFVHGFAKRVCIVWKFCIVRGFFGMQLEHERVVRRIG
ncbi:MAG: hypothetical protein AAB449_02195 [Patescibacteria group bacterium]